MSRFPLWAIFNQRYWEWEAKRMLQLDAAVHRPPLPPMSGGRRGVLIDGVVYPLANEPKTATTKGWGVVPGDPDAGRGR